MRSLFVVAALVGSLLPVAGQDQVPEEVRVAQRALRSSTPEQRSQCMADLSKAYRAADMLDSSRAVADRALREARNDRERGWAHFAIARAMFEQHDHGGVQEHARQVITLGRAIKDTAMWLRGEGILVEVDMDLNRFGPARERDLVMLPIARATKDSAFLSNVNNNLGNLAYLAHHYDTAHAYYDTAITWMTAGQQRDRLILQLNQVNLYIEEERYDAAMALSDHLRAEILQGDATMRAQYFNQRGYAQFNAGHYQEAIAEFIRSDSVYPPEAKALDLQIENTGFLAESYAAIGDSARAYLLMRDLEVLKDSFDRAATNERMLALEKQFETKLSKEEIKRLDGENKQKNERLRAKNILLYGSGALTILALIGVVLVWSNLLQKRKHASVLEELNAELKNKQARIEEINKLLRMKILRTQMDPHFIHNCLNAIKSLSLSGEHEKAEEYLDGFARLLRTVLEHSVRDRIELEEEVDFLRDYVKLEELRLPGDLAWSITAEEILLDEGAMIPSLLVQPFVENAVWHGLAPKTGSKRLTVRFCATDKGVQCVIEDNGVGRAAANSARADAKHRSLGLQLTGERLQLLTDHLKYQGDFSIEDLVDDAGHALGTRVVMNLRDAVG